MCTTTIIRPQTGHFLERVLLEGEVPDTVTLSRGEPELPPLYTSPEIQESYDHYKITQTGTSIFIKTIELFSEIFYHQRDDVLEHYLSSLKIDFGCIPDVQVLIKRGSDDKYFIDVKFPEVKTLISRDGVLFTKNPYSPETRTHLAIEAALAVSPFEDYKKYSIRSQPHTLASRPTRNDETSNPAYANFSRLFRELMNVPALVPNRVLILTTSLGGGHATYASSLEKSLDIRGFEVLILNIEEFTVDLFREMKISSQGTPISTDLCFKERVSAKNPLFAQILTETDAFLQAYTPSNWEDLLDRIYQFAPSIIFSTAYHKPCECLRISSLLEVPLNIITTDHKVVAKLNDYCKDSYVNYFVPGEDPRNLLVEHTRHGTMSCNYLFDSSSNPYEGKEIYPIGNAADKAYFEEYSEEKRLSIKAFYEIAIWEKIILVTSGSCPNIDSILSICKRLSDPLTQEAIASPYKVIVICGDNPDLIRTVHSLGDKFLPFSSVSQAEMAQFFAISDSIIGKPGGAMTAQVEASGAFMIAERMYKWEVPNIRYLQSKQLGRAVSVLSKSSDDFIACIQEGFSKTLERQTTGYTRPKKLDDYIESMIATAQKVKATL